MNEALAQRFSLWTLQHLYRVAEQIASDGLAGSGSDGLSGQPPQPVGATRGVWRVPGRPVHRLESR
jgi:hypothetical protein